MLVDHTITPGTTDLEQAIAAAVRHGAAAIRTSALFPVPAAIVADRGFTPIDRLALLTLTLPDDTTSVARHRSPSTPPTTPLRRWHDAAAAGLDRAAFGRTWGQDVASVRQIRRATPQHRARAVWNDQNLAGFVIAGIAGHRGYLQRLAVDPSYQRRGIATALVCDALAELNSAHVGEVLVNTGITNHAALALYEAVGFRRLSEELVISELLIDRQQTITARPAGSIRRARRSVSSVAAAP